MAENKSNIKIFKPKLSNFKQVVFDNCKLHFSDFQKSELTKVEFVNSDLTKCQMFGVKLKGIDFSSCELDGFAARVEDVRGAVVSTVQAISLTSLLELVIKE